MSDPKIKKPEGANAYFKYVNGSQWCKVLAYSPLLGAYRILSYRKEVSKWSAVPKWVPGARIVFVPPHSVGS